MPLLRLIVLKRLQATINAVRELRGYVEVPELVYKYAEGISKVTGLPLSEVLKSEPVRKYWEKLERKVTVELE